MSLNLVMGLMYLGIKISYCCIDPFTTVSLLLWNLVYQMWELQLLLFVYLFILALHFVGKSFSIPLFWVFVYLWIWNGSGCSIPLGFGCIFWLGDIVDLNLGLLPFDVNWLFYPSVDVNSSLCWCSSLFGIFLERLVLVVPVCV